MTGMDQAAVRSPGPGRLLLRVALVLVVVLLSGGAYAFGRTSAPGAAVGVPRSEATAGLSAGPMMGWAVAQPDDLAWMRVHQAQVTWLRQHPGAVSWMRERSGMVRWMRHHRGMVRWARGHPERWRWMRDHGPGRFVNGSDSIRRPTR